MTTDKRELLPCPFCGREPTRSDVYRGLGNERLRNIFCYCTAAVRGPADEVDAIWNTRPSPPAPVPTPPKDVFNAANYIGADPETISYEIGRKIISQGYDVLLDDDGRLYTLVAGDQGYAPTHIVIEGYSAKPPVQSVGWQDKGDRADALSPSDFWVALSKHLQERDDTSEQFIPRERLPKIARELSALSKDAKASGNQLEEIEQYLIEKSMIRPGERVADKVIRFLKHYQQVIDAYSKLAGKASGPSKDERDAVIEEAKGVVENFPNQGMSRVQKEALLTSLDALKHSPKAGQEEKRIDAIGEAALWEDWPGQEGGK